MKVAAISGQSSNFNSVLRGEIIVVIVKQVSKILCDHSFPKERAVLAACRALRVQLQGCAGSRGRVSSSACLTEKGCLKNPKLSAHFQEMTVSCWNLQ